jgi:hypothetical protein
MKITETFEPVRSIYAPDNGSAYAAPMILENGYRVHYGNSHWPSLSYWLVPNTESSDA